MKKDGVMAVVRHLLLLLLSLALALVAAGAGVPPDPPLAVYTAPGGLQVVSRHPAWTDIDRLRTLHDELLKNTHFEELSALTAVMVLPGTDNPRYQSHTRLGRWVGEIQLFPDFWSASQGRSASPADLAHALAHEYGHHYTLYWTWVREGLDLNAQWQKTVYARVRELVGDPRVAAEHSTALAHHAWSPAEIAAEDYLQLLGSPTARQSVAFPHISGVSGPLRVHTSMFNLHPQENPVLPLAAQVPGLHDFLLGLAGRGPATVQPPTAPVLAAVSLERDRRYRNVQNLELAWARSLDDVDDQVEYTVVELQAPDQPLGLPVVTQTATRTTLPAVDAAGTTRYYRVLAKDAAGLIVRSNLVAVDFDRPVLSPAPKDPLFRDLGPEHWAYGELAPLVQRRLVGGYPDRSFRPRQAVTRGELAALLARSLGLAAAPSPFTDTAGHWAARSVGALARAGLATGVAPGRFAPDAPATRAELAVLTARARGLAGSLTLGPAGSDVAGHWAAGAIALVRAAGLMGGYPDGSFAPDRPVSRAEAAVLAGRLASRP